MRLVYPGKRWLLLAAALAFGGLGSALTAQPNGRGTDVGNGGDVIREVFHEARLVGQEVIAALPPAGLKSSSQAAVAAWSADAARRERLRQKLQDMNHAWLMDDAAAQRCDTLSGDSPDEIILSYSRCRDLPGGSELLGATAVLIKDALLALGEDASLVDFLPAALLADFAARHPERYRQLAEQPASVPPPPSFQIVLDDLTGSYRPTGGGRAALTIGAYGVLRWQIAAGSTAQYQLLAPDGYGRFQALGQWSVPAPGLGLFNDACSYSVRVVIQPLPDGRSLEVSLIRPRRTGGSPCGGAGGWVTEDVRFERN